MFGYVKVFKPELKICEYEQYKAVYCSLCQTLGKRYGLMSRMTLSYDFTFLSVFLMAMSEEGSTFTSGRCPFHPLKKRMLCESSDILDYVADVAVLLTYHKLSDTVSDERFFKRLTARILKVLYYSDYKKAMSRRPREAQAALSFMQEQRAIELSYSPCVDACAEPTAKFLSVLASYNASCEEMREATKRFGYCLGRFVYLADAADDLEEDWKCGSFNPYLVSNQELSQDKIEELRRYASQSLHACVAACAECLTELPIRRFKGILNNVLYQGMPFVIKQICKTKQEESACEKSV